jgi:carboxypeptidase Taq
MLAELRQRLAEVYDLNGAASVLGWDEATYMPAGGAAARGRQSALLRRLAHERFAAPAVGRLIDRLETRADALGPGDAALVRVVRRDYDKVNKVPAAFVERAGAHASASYNAWTRARPADDFAAMVPYLETTLALSREYAGFFAPFASIADPMIDDADPGMTAAKVRALFADLGAELVPLVREIYARPPADDSCLRAGFDEALQIQFGLTAATKMGYNLGRGRLDKTHHPFCTKFSSGDVRITTRVRRDDLGDALFSTLHEAGHAIYEQGVDPALEGTPLGSGASGGVHESQSRLWENVVARSRPFWQHFYPELQHAFPDQLGAVPLDTFHRAINRVEPSLIRTDADEVTYNLHVMLRFDLELDLLEGRLAVKDLPEAWRAGLQAALGVAPPNDRDGCLQDVHWFTGLIGGAFQSYTIGNILSAQFFAAAIEAHPGIAAEIADGEFGTLRAWLTDNIYRHGRALTPDEIVTQATGGPLTVAPYIAYLRTKYAGLG